MTEKDIFVTYSTNIEKATRELLEKLDIEKEIPNKDAKIGLKPNLVIAATPEYGATTHTEIIRELISFLNDHGYHNIIIIESAWVGDSTERAFKVNNYKSFGVPLVDVKKDSYEKVTVKGLTMEISKTALNLDYLISLPVLKGHCQTLMTCALKNQKGLLSDRSKRQFHTWGLMKPIAALNAAIKANLILVDSICGDLDFEEGGNPVVTNRLLLAKDPVLLDTYAASLLGYDIADIEYIPLAHSFGVGSTDILNANIEVLSKPENVSMPQPTGACRSLAKYADANNACSACYASLMHALKRLKDEGIINRLDSKVAIGQGWKGKSTELGVGACTSCAKFNVKGCPPTAKAIYDTLSDLLF